MTDQLKPEYRALIELTRPIIGIENRTAQEAFDIMADRIRSAARTEGRRSGEALEAYDAGPLSDHGGGNVEWWQEYLRAELGRAHDFYQSQVSAPPVEAKPAEGVTEQAIAELIYKSVTHVFAEPVEPNPSDYLPAARSILALIPTRDEAALIQPVMAPSGWVVVPREPTESEGLTRALRVAADHSPSEGVPSTMIRAEFVATVIRAYLAAAPQAQSVSDTDQLPVAWMNESGRLYTKNMVSIGEPGFTPLYTHPATGTDDLPADVVRLVKAAREEKLAGIIMAADDDGVEAIHELFAASNDFASRVPHESGGGHG